MLGRVIKAAFAPADNVVSIDEYKKSRIRANLRPGLIPYKNGLLKLSPYELEQERLRLQYALHINPNDVVLALRLELAGEIKNG